MHGLLILVRRMAASITVLLAHSLVISHTLSGSWAAVLEVSGPDRLTSDRFSVKRLSK